MVSASFYPGEARRHKDGHFSPGIPLVSRQHPVRLEDRSQPQPVRQRSTAYCCISRCPRSSRALADATMSENCFHRPATRLPCRLIHVLLLKQLWRTQCRGCARKNARNAQLAAHARIARHEAAHEKCVAGVQGALLRHTAGIPALPSANCRFQTACAARPESRRLSICHTVCICLHLFDYAQLDADAGH